VKKYIVISLCILGSLNAMDIKPPVPREPREWLAKEYAKGNTSQIACFSSLLKKHKIPTEDKTILSVACGTAEIEVKLVQKAKCVHGIDASKNMINYAEQTHINETNKHILSFEHCFVEDFETQEPYDLALASCCFHWFADKQQALQHISNSLKKDGLFFANIDTVSNPPLGIAVLDDMKRDIPILGRLLSVLPNPTGSSSPTNNELYGMLDKAGFSLIKSEEESFEFPMSEQQFREHQLPILLSTPAAQWLINSTSDGWLTNVIAEGTYKCFSMSEEEQKQHDAPFFPESNATLIEKIRNNNFCRCLFNDFLNRYLKKLKKNNDGTYVFPYATTAILAAKR